ncbi:MAG: hypothetical protein IPP14_15655 [Planctomycetes bacterium]|nr:hypothetical protein [Planctomycetota bacterium]
MSTNKPNGKDTGCFRIWRNDQGGTGGANDGYVCVANFVYGKANAAMIVKAVNAHDDLVAALQMVAEAFKNDSHKRLFPVVFAAVEAALAKAEAK